MCISERKRKIWQNTSTVADRLGVSPSTIRNWIEEGRFDDVRNTGVRRAYYHIEKTSVDRFEVDISMMNE